MRPTWVSPFVKSSFRKSSSTRTLMEKLTENLLVEIAPEAHERKFKKPDHGRWKDIGRNAVFLQIKKDSPVRQIIQDLLRRPFLDLPYPRRPPNREGTDGKPGNPRGILLAEQDLQNRKQRLRRRRPLGKAVETRDEGGVTRLYQMMTQSKLSSPKLAKTRYCRSILLWGISKLWIKMQSNPDGYLR